MGFFGAHLKMRASGLFHSLKAVTNNILFSKLHGQSVTMMGAGGAGVAPPITSLVVDFTTLPDGTLPSLDGATWAIVSGKAINNPTLGITEMLTNGNFDGAYTAGLAASWYKKGTPTLAQETTIVNTPSGSSQKSSVNASFQGVAQNVTVVAGNWYRLSGWIYPTIAVASGIGADNSAHDYTSPAGSLNVFRLTSTSRVFTSTGGAVKFYGGATNEVMYVDDGSFKMITTLTATALKLFPSAYGCVRARWTQP
jgi:hypothetical protein